MILPQDTILENRYRIEVLLSQGGMGAVYKAFDSNLNTLVAIKENFFQTPQSISQFEREAHILARLRHPNLPRVIHHFSTNQRQYLVMDYIEGEDLWQILQRQKHPLDEGKALTYILQVCDAVSYLHRQTSPIIHRDIKPQNIKITPEGQAILVDFGIHKVGGDDNRTQTGAQAVTPGFSPPEQYSSSGTTPLSDIYALGATFYAILVGKKPPDSISRMAGGANYKPPHLLNPQISPEVSQAIEQAMQVRQVDRPQSIDMWRDELRVILSQISTSPSKFDDTVEALTVKSTEPRLIPKPADDGLLKSSNRVWVGLGVLAVILLVGLGIVLTSQLNNSATVTPETVGEVLPAITESNQVENQPTEETEIDTEATVGAILTTAAEEEATQQANIAATSTAIVAATSTQQTEIDLTQPTHTPTPVPTDTPTITPTPTHTTPQFAITSDANLRAGPGTNYDRIGELTAGIIVEIIGRNDDSSWWQIKDPTDETSVAWISTSLGEASNAENVAVVEIPPIPTLVALSTPTSVVEANNNPAVIVCTVSDSTDEQLPGYADIIEANVSLSGENVTVIYTLRDLPEQLIFNRNETAGTFPDYYWDIYIDADANNATGGQNGCEYTLIGMSPQSSIAQPSVSAFIQDKVTPLLIRCQGSRLGVTVQDSSPQLSINAATNQLSLAATVPGITPNARYIIRAQDFASSSFPDTAECISN